MSKIHLELIATSADDCTLAQSGGADRIELVSALAVGGLTPSLGLLLEARQATSLPIMAMVRPREAGFCYSPREFATMLRDAELLLRHGADGLVFGVLTADGQVDVARCRALVQIANGKQAVFHRAFDVTPDPLSALDTLIDLGVTRVLTSGQQASALAGAANIARFIEHAGEQIEILPGGGINSANVRELITHTGCTQVHASLSALLRDPSTAGRPQIAFAGAPPAEGHYRIAKPAALAEMVRLLHG